MARRLDWNTFRKRLAGAPPKKVSYLWKKYKDGKITLEQAQNSAGIRGKAARGRSFRARRAYKRKKMQKAMGNPALGGLETLVPAALAVRLGGPRNVLIGGAGLLAGGAWVAWRHSQRTALKNLIEENPKIFAIRSYYATSGTPLPPEQQWLTKPNGAEIKAAQVIGYFGTMNAAQGFDEVMAQLPAIPAQPPGAVSQLLGQGFKAFEDATGIKVPKSVKREAQGIAQTEQAQSADTIAAQGMQLWNWIFSDDTAKAQQNPGISWGDFLGYYGSI